MARTVLLLMGVLVFAGCSKSHENGAAPGTLPPSWYTLPEKQPSPTTETTPIPQTGAQTDAAIGSVFQANTSALPSAPPVVASWHLDGAIADFAITTNGIFGSLFSNGELAVRGTWRRSLTRRSRTSDLPLRSKSALVVRPTTTRADIGQQIEPTIRSVIAAGLVHPEDESVFRSNLLAQGNRFLSLCQALDSIRLDTGWSVNSFEFQISFNANGQVTPLIGVGGAFNLYFDWVKPAAVQAQAPSDTPDAGLTEFAEALTGAVSQALRDSPDPADSGMSLQQVQVGLGLDASGDIGILQTQESVSARIIFAKDPSSAPRSAYELRPLERRFVKLIAASPRSPDRAYAARAGIPFDGGDYEINAEKVEKGMRNALKMGRYFAEKAREADTSLWKLSEIESEFDLSIGGDLKLTSLSGQGEVVLDFDRTGP